MMKQKEIFILFKTHLDIGFTDYSKNIIEKYINQYIPNAISIGYELKDSQTPFIWTVGSWLIEQALKRDTNGTVEKAIKDGILNWHALPFTTHTELMNIQLFEKALDISKKLDERFNKKTIAAKMTDVPGHTLGMVPLLYDRGVEFLHIGVNPATPVPPVPPIFKWRLDNKEITVMYQGDYGEKAEFEDFILYFAHTGDNLGPQNAEQIVKIYNEIQAEYPTAIIKAVTLNDVAEKIANLKNLPIVENEIGDTWIHGAGTDPKKLSRFRHAMKYISKDADLSDSLLLIPEHTWGMDVKKFFKNDTDFFPEELAPLKQNRKTIEDSWEEQRSFIERAESILGISPDYPTDEPDLTDFKETDIPFDCGIEISWQIFDNSDYARYQKDYMRIDYSWAIWDFTKVGLPNYTGDIYTAKITHSYKKADVSLLKLEFDPEISQKYGLPYFYLKLQQDYIELKWFNKKACRVPQACWLKFQNLTENWQLHKLGHWYKPEDVIGSPLICAVDEGVRNEQFMIRPIDSALVAPFGRRLLQYNCTDVKQDLYFNLYNNIWNTNFPMWYEDDAVFRFTIEKTNKKEEKA